MTADWTFLSRWPATDRWDLSSGRIVRERKAVMKSTKLCNQEKQSGKGAVKTEDLRQLAAETNI
jgi:hypothetical protein